MLSSGSRVVTPAAAGSAGAGRAGPVPVAKNPAATATMATAAAPAAMRRRSARRSPRVRTSAGSGQLTVLARSRTSATRFIRSDTIGLGFAFVGGRSVERAGL